MIKGDKILSGKWLLSDGKIYDEFTELFISLTYNYKLGDPLKSDISLGPVVKLSSAKFIKEQITDAIKNGAKKMIDEKVEFGFAVDWMRKDLKIALEESKKNNSLLHITEIVEQY